MKQGSDNLIYGLGPLYVVKGDGTTLTFARDGSKNVRAELNSLGAVTAAFRYRAYGQLAQSTTASPTYFGLASQLVDASGLYYMRARWYDPGSARFLVRDSKSVEPDAPGTLNAFGYALANPVIATDASGLSATALDDGACSAPCDDAASAEGSGITIISPRGVLSLGLITTLTGEVGNGTLMGAATLSEGQTLLSTANGLRPLDPTGSGFTSYGVYGAAGPFVAGTPQQQGLLSRTGGAYAGVGSGIFLSNAPSARELAGPFEQLNVNIGLIPALLPVVPSISFAWSGNPFRGGTWIATATMGPGLGAAFTKMTTTTVVH